MVDIRGERGVNVASNLCTDESDSRFCMKGSVPACWEHETDQHDRHVIRRDHIKGEKNY